MYNFVTLHYLLTFILSPLICNIHPVINKFAHTVCMGLCMGFLARSTGLAVCIYSNTGTSLCLNHHTSTTHLPLDNTRQPFSPALLLPREVLVHSDALLLQTSEELACQLKLSFLCGSIQCLLFCLCIRVLQCHHV